jgi:hypothetical protein
MSAARILQMLTRSIYCTQNYINVYFEFKFLSTQISQVKEFFMFKKIYTGCLKTREFRIQSVVGDHFSSLNMEIKKKSGLPPLRYIGLKVHSLNCVFFKYRLKSSVFIVIYGVDYCRK